MKKVLVVGAMPPIDLMSRMGQLGLNTTDLKTYETLPAGVKAKMESNQKKKPYSAFIPFHEIKKKADAVQITIEVNSDMRKIKPFLDTHKERYLQIVSIPDKKDKNQALIDFLRNVCKYNGIELKHFFRCVRKLKQYYEEN